ncbi:MAG: MmgE/PrpD family protein [bacterium]
MRKQAGRDRDALTGSVAGDAEHGAPSLTQAFARFLCHSRYSDLSPVEIRAAKNIFIDTIAACLAGTREEPARKVLRFLARPPCGGPAVVVGSAVRTHPSMAALANGTLAHCLDYDDLSHPMMAHPSTVLVPVVLALADTGTVSGRDALLAYAAGLEVGAKLGRILNPGHYEKGWHGTSTLGVMAAASTASRLLGLDRRRTSMALGLAASQASGLRRNFGTMAKPFHAGHAARCGLESALLAASGFSAGREVLEGPMGFLELYGGGPPDPERVRSVLASLGRPFELSASGLAVKLYPCCAGSHPAVDAVLLLRARAARPLDRLQRVVLRVHPLVPRMMIYDRPGTPLEAKFSLRYCAAAALADGQLTLASFAPKSLRRRRTAHWMDRLEILADLEDDAGRTEIPTRAEAAFHWENGASDRLRVELPRGNPGNPLPDEFLRKKFLECAALALPEKRVRTLLDLLERLEERKDLRELTRRLAAPV